MPRPVRLLLLPAALLATLLAGGGPAAAQGTTPISGLSTRVSGNCPRFVVRGLSASADRRSLNLDYDVAGLPPDNIAQFDVSISVARGGTTVTAASRVTWRQAGAGTATLRPSGPLPADLGGATATIQVACSGRPGGMGGGF